MKKAFGLMLILATVTLAGAQTKKGTWLLGTYLGSGYVESNTGESKYAASSNTYKSSGSSFGIGIDPTFGYFIADNFAIGVSLDLSYYSDSGDSSQTSSTVTSTSKSSELYAFLGPFFRFYFGGAKAKGRPYFEASAGVSLYPSYSGEYSSSSGDSYTVSYTKYSGVKVAAVLGYEYYLNPSVGLQYYVGYSYSSFASTYAYDYKVGTDYSSESKSSYGSFNFGVGLQIHLGPKN
jgi:outer membrane protein W